MSATVTRLPATPAVGLREATRRFTGRDRFEPTTVAAYRETLDALWGHLGEIPVDAITVAGTSARTLGYDTPEVGQRCYPQPGVDCEVPLT